MNHFHFKSRILARSDCFPNIGDVEVDRTAAVFSITEFHFLAPGLKDSR